MTSDATGPGRREFVLQTLSFLPLAAGGAELIVSARAAHASGGYTPVFFDQQAWRFLNAFVDRLIPADENGPGAIEAGVPIFIDMQMQTPYGYGKLWYMQGPFHQAAPELGYQLPLTPRDIYAKGIPDAEQAIKAKFGRSLVDLDPATQDEALKALETGSLKLDALPAGTFFGAVVQNTHEGYFSDPVYGGNEDMGAWKMIGFPGARADYTDWVEQYGVKYPFPPASVQGEGS